MYFLTFSHKTPFKLCDWSPLPHTLKCPVHPHPHTPAIFPSSESDTSAMPEVRGTADVGWRSL